MYICTRLFDFQKSQFSRQMSSSTIIKIKMNVDEKSTKSDKSKNYFHIKDLSDNVLLKKLPDFHVK